MLSVAAALPAGWWRALPNGAQLPPGCGMRMYASRDCCRFSVLDVSVFILISPPCTPASFFSCHSGSINCYPHFNMTEPRPQNPNTKQPTPGCVRRAVAVVCCEFWSGFIPIPPFHLSLPVCLTPNRWISPLILTRLTAPWPPNPTQTHPTHRLLTSIPGTLDGCLLDPFEVGSALLIGSGHRSGNANVYTPF